MLVIPIDILYSRQKVGDYGLLYGLRLYKTIVLFVLLSKCQEILTYTYSRSTKPFKQSDNK